MERVLTDPRPREDRLHQHGPRHHVRERQAADRDDGGKGCPQHVTQDDGVLRQPLRTGRLNVVVVDHLEHRRAGEARQEAHVVGREHARRKNQMLQRAREDVELAGDQRVDRVEACHVRRRSHAWIKPSAARHPAQLKKEDVKGDQREPEGGHGNAAEGDDAEHLVGKPVAPYGGDDAERDPERERDQDRRQRELGRGRHVLAQVGADRPVALLGFAQVAVGEVLQIERVLDRKRLVQAVVLAKCLDGGGVADGALPEVGGRGIAGYELRQGECDEGDA